MVTVALGTRNYRQQKRIDRESYAHQQELDRQEALRQQKAQEYERLLRAYGNEHRWIGVNREKYTDTAEEDFEGQEEEVVEAKFRNLYATTVTEMRKDVFQATNLTHEEISTRIPWRIGTTGKANQIRIDSWEARGYPTEE